MPKPSLSDMRRSKASDTVAKAPARGKRSVSKKTDKRPTIMPAESVHHCTPPVVLDGIVYPVLGRPVDLDPCTNDKSIVEARRHIIFPAEDGLAISWRGKVYCNPPYGMPEILQWIRKIVIEHRTGGAEIIALLPAHMSSSWFDVVVATARACFLWGPGMGNRRVKFGGNADAAAFDSAVVYWGPNLPLFAAHAARFCHPWFPEHDLRLLRALLGDARLPEGPSVSLAAADEILALSRHDDLVEALACMGRASLGEILDAGDSLLNKRLRQLSAYELGVALLCASRTRPPTWIDGRLHASPRAPDPRQLDLVGPAQAALCASAGDASHLPADEAIAREVRVATFLEGSTSARAVAERLGQPTKEIRRALARLAQQGIIQKQGRDTFALPKEQTDAAR